MYIKIAFGNVSKSLRDFSVFFITLLFGVCVFYAFNSIVDQTAVMDLTSDQRRIVAALMDILDGVSVLVVIILAALVIYANRFLMRRRKHEFGIYLTLGMDVRHVSFIIAVETLVVGIVALMAGLLLGVALAQVMMYLTASLFEATITGFVFSFSTTACTRTILCFMGIFCVSLIFNMIAVARFRLIDLINARRMSEQAPLRSLPLSVALFVVALALIGTAYYLLVEHGILEAGPYFAISTGLVTVGTLLLFFSVSGFLVRLVQKSSRVYYSGLTMFVVRQLTSRINTAWLSMSLVCAMLFVAVCGVCTGFSIVTGLNEQLQAASTYDVTLYSYPTGLSTIGEGIAAEYDYDAIATLREDIPEFDELFSAAVQINEYRYDASGTPLSDYTLSWFVEHTDFEWSALLDTTLASVSDITVALVKLSEYNALRVLAGEDPVELADDECLLWCDYAMLEDFWNAAVEQNPTLEIGEYSLSFADEPLVGVPSGDSSASGTVTGAIIVPDAVVPEVAVPSYTIVNLMYTGERAEMDEQVLAILGETYGDILYSASVLDAWPVWNAITAQQLLDQASGTTTAVIYLAIYIGFILLVSCAAVLALQQLSEAADNVGRYRVLNELGCEGRLITRALLVQIGMYFLFPIVVAVAHASVALNVIIDIVELLVGCEITTTLIASFAFIVVIYGIYYLATYSTAKRVILRA